MHKHLFFLSASFFWIFSLAGCALSQNGEEIGTLMSQGKDEGWKENQLNLEDARFHKVEKAIGDLTLLPGRTNEAVKKRFDEPVIIIETNGTEKWLYKARYRGWFNAPKIYLYFKNGILTDWECVNFSCREA